MRNHSVYRDVVFLRYLFVCHAFGYSYENFVLAVAQRLAFRLALACSVVLQRLQLVFYSCIIVVYAYLGIELRQYLVVEEAVNNGYQWRLII